MRYYLKNGTLMSIVKKKLEKPWWYDGLTSREKKCVDSLEEWSYEVDKQMEVDRVNHLKKNQIGKTLRKPKVR
jgi:hypothetical protein